MNERDKTAQMMQDSSGQHWGTEAHFQRFAALVRADEREACAKVCDEVERKATKQPPMVGQGCQACATAIRARGNT